MESVDGHPKPRRLTDNEGDNRSSPYLTANFFPDSLSNEPSPIKSIAPWSWLERHSPFAVVAMENYESNNETRCTSQSVNEESRKTITSRMPSIPQSTGFSSSGIGRQVRDHAQPNGNPRQLIQHNRQSTASVNSLSNSPATCSMTGRGRGKTVLPASDIAATRGAIALTADRLIVLDPDNSSSMTSLLQPAGDFVSNDCDSTSTKVVVADVSRTTKALGSDINNPQALPVYCGSSIVYQRDVATNSAVGVAPKIASFTTIFQSPNRSHFAVKTVLSTAGADSLGCSDCDAVSTSDRVIKLLPSGRAAIMYTETSFDPLCCPEKLKSIYGQRQTDLHANATAFSATFDIDSIISNSSIVSSTCSGPRYYLIRHLPSDITDVVGFTSTTLYNAGVKIYELRVGPIDNLGAKGEFTTEDDNRAILAQLAFTYETDGIYNNTEMRAGEERCVKLREILMAKLMQQWSASVKNNDLARRHAPPPSELKLFTCELITDRDGTSLSYKWSICRQQILLNVTRSTVVQQYRNNHDNRLQKDKIAKMFGGCSRHLLSRLPIFVDNDEDDSDYDKIEEDGSWI